MTRASTLFVALCVALIPLLSRAEDRALGDSKVIARLPATPGFPEGILLQGNTIYVSAQARFGTALQGPPEVQSFDVHSGALLERYVIETPDPTRDHGLSGMAFDSAGRLYVLDTQKGIVRIDLANGAQEIYASPFPDLLPCPLASPCSPTLADNPPLPNAIAFDPAGNAYVSDSLQATIWRVRPWATLPRSPEVWFQDGRLNGALGPNGLRLNPSRTMIYLAQSVDVLGRGPIYTLPLNNPLPSDLDQPFHRYASGAIPDEIAFGRSGKLYVTLAGAQSAISVLLPDGTEAARYLGPAHSESGSVPYDMPSGLVFSNQTRALLVNNHSEFLGLEVPDRFVVFDVFVDDRGVPSVRPNLP